MTSTPSSRGVAIPAFILWKSVGMAPTGNKENVARLHLNAVTASREAASASLMPK